MRTHTIKRIVTLVAPGIAASQSGAAELKATIEIPQLDVAEYHRPYVAAWIETPEREVAADLAVWYDIEMADREGETWLKDLRQWWRKSGRAQDLPVDGVSGPTRPVGKHEIAFTASKSPLSDLAAGSYNFVVEASREVGGRELIRIPFEWKPGTSENVAAQGERELGSITFSIAND